MAEHRTSKRDKSQEKKIRHKENVEEILEEPKRKHGDGPFSLLAAESAVNPALSSLFAPKPLVKELPNDSKPSGISVSNVDALESDVQSETEVEDGTELAEQPINAAASVSSVPSPEPEDRSKRKRKRKQRDEEIEDVYMRRLAHEEAKDAEALAKTKRQKTHQAAAESGPADEDDEVAIEVENVSQDELNDSTDVLDQEDQSSPPPRHETQQAADDEVSKANRTVFLGNVSTSAISSKSSRKTLINSTLR